MDSQTQTYWHYTNPMGGEQLQQEYEQKPYNVICDLCGTEDYASERDLRRKGWLLNYREEICPMHD